MRVQSQRPTGAVVNDDGRPAHAHAESATSGNDDYLAACRMATLDAGAFADFRRHPDYTKVLEHVSEGLGHQYLQLISAQGRARRGLHEAAKNDDVGNPRTMRLDSGLVISPTTLRYLKVADDIETHFGSIDGADVIEIGVGYGGQCRILDSLFKLNSVHARRFAPGAQPYRRISEQVPAEMQCAVTNHE